MAIDPNSIVVLLVALTGLIGMPIIQLVKTWTGLQDKPALWLAVGISALLGVGISYLNGVFVGIEPTPESIAGVVSAVFAIATVMYRVIVKGSPAAEEPPAPEA